MSTKSLAVTAIENAGIKMIEKGAARVMRSIPKGKQDKVIAALFIGGAALLLFAATMLVKKRSHNEMETKRSSSDI